MRVSSKSNLVNLVKALLGSKSDVQSFEAKNRVFQFDYQPINMFEFIRCLKNDVRVRSMFDKMVFDPSLVIFQCRAKMSVFPPLDLIQAILR